VPVASTFTDIGVFGCVAAVSLRFDMTAIETVVRWRWRKSGSAFLEK